MNGGKRDGITYSFIIQVQDECSRTRKLINSPNEDLAKEVKNERNSQLMELVLISFHANLKTIFIVSHSLLVLKICR